MKVIATLMDSVRLLFRKPKIFLPNLFASSIYGLFEFSLFYMLIMDIGMLSGSASTASTGLAVQLPMLFAVLLMLPFIGAIDLITYSMYPSLVCDYAENRTISLRKSFKDALYAWRFWVSLGVLFILFTIAVCVPVGGLLSVAIILKIPLLAILGVAVFFLASLTFMLLMFFVIPIGVLEKDGLISSIKKSIRLGFDNKWDITRINLIMFILACSVFFIGSPGDSFSSIAAGALFFLVKFLQSVLCTYVSVINPVFYLSIPRD